LNPVEVTNKPQKGGNTSEFQKGARFFFDKYMFLSLNNRRQLILKIKLFYCAVDIWFNLD